VEVSSITSIYRWEILDMTDVPLKVTYSYYWKPLPSQVYDMFLSNPACTVTSSIGSEISNVRFLSSTMRIPNVGFLSSTMLGLTVGQRQWDLCSESVSFGILGLLGICYTADDLGFAETATKAAIVIDTCIIPLSSRMSWELQICSWQNTKECINI
jgi:hypothetical protein